jgi:hypothetical protein
VFILRNRSKRYLNVIRRFHVVFLFFEPARYRIAVFDDPREPSQISHFFQSISQIFYNLSASTMPVMRFPSHTFQCFSQISNKSVISTISVKSMINLTFSVPSLKFLTKLHFTSLCSFSS